MHLSYKMLHRMMQHCLSKDSIFFLTRIINIKKRACVKVRFSTIRLRTGTILPWVLQPPLRRLLPWALISCGCGGLKSSSRKPWMCQELPR